MTARNAEPSPPKKEYIFSDVSYVTPATNPKNKNITFIHNPLIQVILAAFLCLGFGCIMSIMQSNWGWLERSGSLVVVVAIFFFWKDAIEANNAIYEQMRAHYQANMDAAKQSTGEPAEGASYIYLSSTNPKSLISNSPQLANLYQKVDVSLAAFGTIIWGYACPIMNFIYPLSASC